MKAQKHRSQSSNSTAKRAKTASARNQAPKWWRVLSAAQQAEIRARFTFPGSKSAPSSPGSRATRQSERTVTFLIDWQFAGQPQAPAAPARD